MFYSKLNLVLKKKNIVYKKKEALYNERINILSVVVFVIFYMYSGCILLEIVNQYLIKSKEKANIRNVAFQLY